MDTKTCEMCEKQPAVETVNVHTIPGSFDTRYIPMEMCYECASSYRLLLLKLQQRGKPHFAYDQFIKNAED